MKKSRLLLQIAFLFVWLGCAAQQTPDRHPKFHGCWTGFDNFFNEFADSLNYIGSNDPLPIYLNDYLVDWKQRDRFAICVFDPTERISFRKVILNRVFREDVLERIINSKNRSYDSVYVPEKMLKINSNSLYNDFPDLPYMNFSWRQLAKIRLENIRNEKDVFKRKRK